MLSAKFHILYCMLPVTVARSSSDDNAVCKILRSVKITGLISKVYKYSYMLADLARSAKLPNGLYILPSVISFFFYLF